MKAKPAPASTSLPPQPASARRKLSYKEQRELDSLPERIDALEQEQRSIQDQLADGMLYATSPAEATQLTVRMAEIEEALMSALERWEALGAVT